MSGPRLVGAGGVVGWTRTDGRDGQAVGRLAATGGGWTCDGTEVLVGPGQVRSCAFRVDLDPDWRTRHVEVDVVDAAGRRRLVLDVRDGRWTRVGTPVPELDGCLDVDIAATPLTSTIAIRRLSKLAVGDRATVDVAWIDVPSTRVVRVQQTYTRLDARRWRYCDATSGAVDLGVDLDGLVVDHEGRYARVLP